MPFSSLHPLPCSLSAGGEIQMWRETGTGKAKGEREGEGDRNPHPPVTDFIVQDLFGQGLYRHTHTHKQLCTPNNEVPLDDKARLSVCVFLLRMYVCVFVCAHLMTKQSMNNILLEICCRYLAELFTGGSWPGMKLLFSFSGEREGNQYRPERAKQTVSNSCMPASPPPLCFAPSIFVKFSHLHHQVGPGADNYI